MTAIQVLSLIRPFLSRQMQVVALWLLGFSYSEIAQAMVVSHKTVVSHLDNVQEKWDTTTRGEMRLRAFENGFSSHLCSFLS